MRYKVYLAILFCLFICDSSRGQGIPQWGNWNAWGEYQDSLYRNPIIPADFSDIDCIRVRGGLLCNQFYFPVFSRYDCFTF